MSDPEGDEGQEPVEDGPKTAPKFIYECQRDGHSCRDRNYVEVTLADLRAWTEDQTLASLFHHLRLVAVGRPYLDVVLASDAGVKAHEEGDQRFEGCPLFDEENKICNIYHSMPLYCRSFPLGYNGSNFYIKDRECPGIGKGDMTTERLKAHRDAARQELEARRECGLLLPSLQGLFTRFFVEASTRALDAMSPEDRKNLEEIMAKQVRGGPGDVGGDAGGDGDEAP